MLSWVDFLYLVLLLASIPYGFLLNSLTSPKVKQYMCFCAGATITLSLNGVIGSLHSCITISGNYIISRLLIRHRYLPLVSFVFAFGYLLFYRTCNWFGFPQPPKHSNAVQLLVTLRMISLSFEIHDNITNSENNDDKKTNNSSRKNKINELNTRIEFHDEMDVSLFEFLTYGYSYIGLLTGPFYTYTTFKQMINRATCSSRCLIWPTIKNLKLAPFLAIVYYVLKENFPLHQLHEKEFLEESSFFYCLYIITFTSLWFRWRFYIGWLLAQSSCISCGLGAYPLATKPKPGAGPTTIPRISKIIPGKRRISNDKEYDAVDSKDCAQDVSNINENDFNLVESRHGFAAFIIDHTIDGGNGIQDEEESRERDETIPGVKTRKPHKTNLEVWNFESIHNIDFMNIEFGASMKSLMREWNMTVQWWMSEYVHKRLPFSNYYLKLLTTLSISAFWHGLHGGYYLSFLSAILMVFAQAGVVRCLNATDVNDNGVYRWLSWFFLFRYIDYIAIPFMLLEWDTVIKVWSKMWFYGHVMVVGFIFLSLLLKMNMDLKRTKDKL